MIIPETLRDALAYGYIISERKYKRGYLSRKINELDQRLKVAGGMREGQLYVELPCRTSTTYHYICYLTKPIDK